MIYVYQWLISFCLFRKSLVSVYVTPCQYLIDNGLFRSKHKEIRKRYIRDCFTEKKVERNDEKKSWRFNVCISEMEKLVNFIFFHLYPLTSLNNDLHSYAYGCNCNVLLKLLSFYIERYNSGITIVNL